jgi:hypothetical protein
MAATAAMLLLLIILLAFLADATDVKERVPKERFYRLYQDMHQPVEERVKDLLSRMTLLEKIGQMTQTERSITNYTNIKEYSIGGYAFYVLLHRTFNWLVVFLMT